MIVARTKSRHKIDLRTDNQDISETQNTKFLGVSIDDNLN